MTKRQYPRIRCNDIVNNSRHYGNCYSEHWINAVLKVQQDPSLCHRCDCREPVLTHQDRVLRCRAELYRLNRPYRPKQMKLQFESIVNDELPF